MTNEDQNFLREKLISEYGEEEAEKIIRGYQKLRPTTLRVNTMKIAKEEVEEELRKKEIPYKEVSWYDDALIVPRNAKAEIEKLSIYQRGEIYLQSLSSMLPPLFLNPQPKETILDMTAAPGGKTTQLYNLSDGKAMITACEKNKIRRERLKKNLEIQNATRVSVLGQDATMLDSYFSFDKILLDAPCSGSGTIFWEDEEQKRVKDLLDKLPKEQERLLRKAIELLKLGKEMIYSTCSILKEENENVIRSVLEEGKAELVPLDTSNLKEVVFLSSTLENTITICPSEQMEGFFIAKLRKK